MDSEIEKTSSDEKKEKKFSFGKFLKKSSGLLTVFGILNALLIYSSSMPYKRIGAALSVCFLILSLMVWLEVIRKMARYKVIEGLALVQYTVFFFCAGLIELFLILHLIKRHTGFVVNAIFAGAVLLIAITVTMLLVRIFRKQLNEATENKRALLGIIFSAIAVGYAIAFFTFAGPLFFDDLIKFIEQLAKEWNLNL